MASFAALLKEKGKTLNVSDIVVPKIQMIHYQKLKSSKKNFYRQDQIEELADSIELVGMVLQPLIVCKTDMGEYEVLAGHRRMGACIHNVEVKKLKKYEQIPCIEIVAADLIKEMIEEYQEKGMDAEEAMDVFAEYIIIATNSTARGELTDYEKVMQAARLQIIIPIMHGDEELKGRALRAEIAKEMKVSNGTIGNYMNIYNNLVPMGMEMLEYGVLGITMASKICSLDPEVQKELLSQERITDADILRYKNPPATDAEVTEETAVEEMFECEQDNIETDYSEETQSVEMKIENYAAEGEAQMKEAEKITDLVMSDKCEPQASMTKYEEVMYSKDDVAHLLQTYSQQVDRVLSINQMQRVSGDDRVLKKSVIIRDALTAYLRQFES